MNTSDINSNREAPHQVIIGASSGIASALIHRIRSRTPSDGSPIITAISRSPEPDNWGGAGIDGAAPFDKALWLQTDHEENSIRRICENHKQRLANADTIFICNGKLHDLELQPEKRLADFSVSNFQEVLHCNVLIPLLWLQNLQRLIPRKKPVNIVIFSARVGSISDNHLGGWYSYRSSKAALNMLVKSFAIELARTRPCARLILFHPGTTDTPLSQPFQKNVPTEKLFSPDYVAKRLLRLLSEIKMETNLAYVDWEGKRIPW